MGKEIERKFLLGNGPIPIPRKHGKFRIKQAYIFADKHKQVRIRLTTDKAVIGIKFTENAIEKDEFEYEIPFSDGKEIFLKCVSKLEKKRLSFEAGDLKYDIDTFPNGLTFVEVEFPTKEASVRFRKPSWFGKEITGVKKYSNINLAKQSLKFH